MENNLEITDGGLKCDNPKCDWKDATISFDNYKSWIDKSCPKCGENVLTEEDYKNAELVRLSINYINSMSKEDLDKLSENLSEEEIMNVLKNSQLFKDSNKNFNDIKIGDTVNLTIETHKEIKVTNITKIEKKD